MPGQLAQVGEEHHAKVLDSLIQGTKNMTELENLAHDIDGLLDSLENRR